MQARTLKEALLYQIDHVYLAEDNPRPQQKPETSIANWVGNLWNRVSDMGEEGRVRAKNYKIEIQATKDKDLLKKLLDDVGDKLSSGPTLILRLLQGACLALDITDDELKKTANYLSQEVAPTLTLYSLPSSPNQMAIQAMRHLLAVKLNAESRPNQTTFRPTGLYEDL